MDWHRHVQEQQQRRRAAPRAFVRAISDNNRAALDAAWKEVEEFCVWETTMRLCARLQSVSTDMQEAFLLYWTRHGCEMRCAGSDLVLLNALHVLLPPYRGPDKTLYRGESARNRRYRTYGPSWSASAYIAEGFARGQRQMYDGGTVLLRATVPAHAIISAPCIFDEEEFIVDRRRLKMVEELARYDAGVSEDQHGV